MLAAFDGVDPFLSGPPIEQEMAKALEDVDRRMVFLKAPGNE